MPLILETILLARRALHVFPFLTLNLLTILLYTASETSVLYAFLLCLLLPKCHPYSKIVEPISFIQSDLLAAC